MRIALLLAFAASGAFGQSTFHVTGVHRATDAERTYKTVFVQDLISGDIDGKHYTVEQLQSWGSYHFQVGTDYPVVKVDDKTVRVRVADKKGRESTESLNVVTIGK